MPKSKFKSAAIAGIVTAIPQIKKRIDDEASLFGNDSAQLERLKKTIGLNERYVVDDATTSADLCECAANELINSMSIQRDSIDAVILVTQTPDYFQPATAAYLHGVLQLSENCAAFDVNLGCSGYVYGMWLAFMMIESGGCQNVLLLAGDTMSKCVSPQDRSVAPLFGDAGTATLITASDKGIESFFSLHTNGRGFKHIMIPAGGFRLPKSAETAAIYVDDNGNSRCLENLTMNGAEVFNFSIKVEPKAIQEILDYAGLSQEDIDFIVFHQANKYIISNITRRLKFPLEKAPCGTVEKYGNQSSASIPATICDSLSDAVASGAVKVVLSGFGVGLSWASCITSLDHVFSKLVAYQKKKQENES